MRVDFTTDPRPASLYDDDDIGVAPDKKYHDEERDALEEAFSMIRATPSTFVEAVVKIPCRGELDRFSFDDRPYLRAIYDSPARRKLLMAGRQVEKSQSIQALTSRSDGYLIRAGDVKVGDRLATMETEVGARVVDGEVTWVSRVYTKPCVRITTRQGHEVEVATTHPMRLWGRWVEAGDLKVKDRIGVVRACGVFTETARPSDARVALTAYMIGDGGLSQDTVSFTKGNSVVVDDFLSMLELAGGTARREEREGTTRLFLHRQGWIYRWLEEDGLLGHKSGTKFIPEWVFGLSQQQTSLFLNRLWATDGHCKQNSKTKYSLEYSTTSKLLARQVQSLLWKFSIPTRMRKNWPNYWKKRGIKKDAYILRVETIDGIQNFMEYIGAFGKDGGLELPDHDSNNNRDTYPIDVNDALYAILESREGGDDWHTNRADSLHAYGLRRKLKYPPTREKLAQYVQFFRRNKGFDQERVEKLAAHIDTDIYWDEIEKIEDIGGQECVDFEVSPYHNFVIGGFITHNSTMLGNMSLTYMAMTPYFRALYVSPSNQQTKVFSRDRIAEPISLSPYLKSNTNHRILANVFERKLVNKSQITLRFAFLNADRCRGIPADAIIIDEFQDILLENVPVIEECASHSQYKYFTYAGTPKSLDNAIEYYWTRFSTQNEWVVPCRRHGTPKNPSTWHWNVLDEANIGEDGLICDRCGNPIEAKDPDAQWAALNPEPDVEKPYEGYRIPQLMVPWMEWSDILNKQRLYSRAKFYNEVLGRSYDSGTRPLTRRDIKRNCWDDLSMLYYREAIQYCQQYPLFMGLDWGSGENTYTVMCIGGYLPFAPERFTWIYFHRFEGLESEPDRQLKIIKRHIRDFNVRHVGVDYGGGFWPNDDLTRTFGADKIKKYQWVGNVKKKIAFDAGLGIPRHLCHRTEVMSDVFNAIKRGDVFYFPRWEEFDDPYASDFLNIFSEYNERLRINIYKCAPGVPDDSFHALSFGFLASFYTHPRPDIILPSASVTSFVEGDELDITSSPAYFGQAA